MKYDVLVIGAGAAGIAAAVAAADSGLKTAIIERYGFVGGLASSAMVGTVCGLYFRDEHKQQFAVQGFARRFAERLIRLDGYPVVGFDRGLHFLPYRINSFQRLGSEILTAAGVDVYLHTQLIKVTTSGDRITSAGLQTGAEHWRIAPATVLDCSGQAMISIQAGLPVYEQQYYQYGAIVIQVSGLPDLDERLLMLNLIRSIKRGIHDQQLQTSCERLSIVPGTLANGIALLKLGLTTAFDSDKATLTEYELNARQQCYAIIDYLNQQDEDFKNLNIIAMPTQVGIRSGPRPVGLQCLEERQVLNAEKPCDGVAIGTWPIELWSEQRKPVMKYFASGDYYLIPAGALVSADLDNLFFAGRGFSAAETAMASARVIGTCLSSGYAAGKLASVYLQKGDWRCGIQTIQRTQVWSNLANT